MNDSDGSTRSHIPPLGATLLSANERASDTLLSAIEQRVLILDVAESLTLSPRELDTLLADPGFHSSLGQPAHATHFRKSLRDGRGLHLVIDSTGNGTLHWDRYDPHRSPAGMLMHLLTDSPRETLTLLAAGAAVFRRLGR